MMHKNQKKSQGQILVIFAISLLTLLFFVGLALDAGSLYITYGHLKRAVDSAAIGAANEFKRGANSTDMRCYRRRSNVFNEYRYEQCEFIGFYL